jgi:hypothetical protein
MRVVGAGARKYREFELASTVVSEAVGRHRGLTQNTMINITVSHDYAKRNLPPAKKW